jgi:hypothetical protein
VIVLKRNGAALLGAALLLSACRDAPKAGAGVAPRELGATWQEMPGNPLLPPGACLSWNCAGVGDRPLRDKTPVSIGFATSPDGIRWTRHPQNPVIEPGKAGSWNDLRVVAPDVVVEPDGSLLMVAHGQSRHDRTSGAIGFWRSEP